MAAGIITFERAHVIRAPIERVLALYRSQDVLAKLTPPALRVHVVRGDTLGPDSVLEFTLSPPFCSSTLSLIRWRAVHSGFATRRDEYGNTLIHEFRDTMEVGPLASWTHVHSFHSRTLSHGAGGKATRVVDTIHLSHREGPMGLATRLVFSHSSLHMLFAYRALMSAWLLER
mmetsp:Transcript_21915/g.68180  ORF Transcript_21915/g.68180 Transcript_21915/m.68180 type:complete len:173 (-) Transcript_21915:196-714(-)